MRRLDLVADCDACTAICCVALPFDASEDFAFDKPAGVACRHLRSDHRCSIHDHLGERGLSGCAVFDCYGAGPRVTRAFAEAPERERHEAFRVLRGVHELLWLLTEAAKLCPSTRDRLAEQLASAIEGLDAIATGSMAALLRTDLRECHDRTHALLRRVGEALGGRERLRPGGANDNGLRSSAGSQAVEVRSGDQLTCRASCRRGCAP